MSKYDNFSKNQLIKHIEEIEKQLKSNKYGLYWAKSIEGEDFNKVIINSIPVFENKDTITSNNSNNNNLLLEGDNINSLSSLKILSNGIPFVDLIYIDPPYNTGNKDFIYNDKFVEVEDGYRHSKWLNFMEKRLIIARDLLKEDGVIFISIDDNEQSNLELLCNSIFGEKNKIAKFIWEKTQHFGRQKINFYSNGEYVLCYAKKITDSNGKIKELLVEKIITELEDAPLYNASNKLNTLVFPKHSVKFNIKDGTYNSTKNNLYELISPVTIINGRNVNELILRFKSRWSQSTIDQEFKKGTTFWVKSEGFAIRTIYHEGKSSKSSPKQIIFTNTNNPLVSINDIGIKPGVNEEGSNDLDKIVQQNIFSYPKPVSLIKYLISLLFNYKKELYSKDSVILDFFAGSGTTGQAVLELNQEDGGNRRFILCTNNENNICTDVTYPRLKTVITGIRADGTKYSEGIPANLHYFKTDFIPNNGNSDQSKYDLVEKVNHLICISENVFNLVEQTNKYFIYSGSDGAKDVFMYIDYYDTASFDIFKNKIESSNATEKIVYVFSTDNTVDERLFQGIKGIELKPIPSKMYEIYKEIVEEIKRG